MAELITNGEFDSDVDGWTQADGTVAYSSDSGGVMRLSDGSSTAIARQSITTNGSMGILHTLSIDMVALGANDEVTVNIGTSAGASDLGTATYSATGTGNEITFTPTTTTTHVEISAVDTGAGAVQADVDNVSVSGPSNSGLPYPHIAIPFPNVREGDAFTATVRFRNLAGESVVPSAARYRVDDLSTRVILKDWTALTVAADIDILMTSTFNAMQDQSLNAERRQLVVESNQGQTYAVRDARGWHLRNIEGF